MKLTIAIIALFVLLFFLLRTPEPTADQKFGCSYQNTDIASGECK